VADRGDGGNRSKALLAGRLVPIHLPYWQVDWCQSTLLLLGNEGAGLAAPLLALADQRVSIPHSEAVESLNVAVAAAPLLLERWRQTLCAESRSPGGTMPASFATSR
jgi:tRNA C32,U32 (ribose-2'-O)-methylase TrmJ